MSKCLIFGNLFFFFFIARVFPPVFFFVILGRNGVTDGQPCCFVRVVPPGFFLLTLGRNGVTDRQPLLLLLGEISACVPDSRRLIHSCSHACRSS